MFRALKELSRFSRGERAVLGLLVLLIGSGWGAGHLAVGAAERDSDGWSLSNRVMAQAADGTSAASGGSGAADSSDASAAPDGTPPEAVEAGTSGNAGAPVQTEGAGAACAAGEIDVNRAASLDLEMLQGIGPVLAERILKFREAHGPFSELSGLLDVKGIGPATLAKLEADACAGLTETAGS